MKIGTIVLPFVASDAAAQLARLMCKSFGGVTHWNGNGAWITPEGDTEAEPVTIFQSATDMEPAAALAEFRSIARTIGAYANQRSMYLVFDGRAELLDTSSSMYRVVDGKAELADTPKKPIGTLQAILDYENGNLSEEDTVSLFQNLIDTGLAWTLQGAYGRQARRFIDEGLCHAKEK